MFGCFQDEDISVIRNEFCHHPPHSTGYPIRSLTGYTASKRAWQMTAHAPLQQCKMQMKLTDLLQRRAVKSLVALLKPPDRDIPKRAEV